MCKIAIFNKEIKKLKKGLILEGKLVIIYKNGLLYSNVRKDHNNERQTEYGGAAVSAYYKNT